ncbi:hypothetical protein Gotri_014248, partial [Gossypium trilobum]|nr:hypothetical protein [Gossypium trilobum]
MIVVVEFCYLDQRSDLRFKKVVVEEDNLTEYMFRYIDKKANETPHRLAIEGIRGGGTTYLTNMIPSSVMEEMEKDN